MDGQSDESKMVSQAQSLSLSLGAEYVHHPYVDDLDEYAQGKSCCRCSWFEQSETIDESSTVSENNQQTTGFVQGMNGSNVWKSASEAPGDTADYMSGAELGEFLKRPVQIYQTTWLETDAVATTKTFNPWTLYFSSSIIQNKLNNYAFLRCNLKLTVMVNASPFYYGAMNMVYLPLPVFHPSTIVNDAATRYFIPLSQRPHMWIFPQENQGGEMTLPFMKPQNWIRTAISSDFDAMGSMSLVNFTTLQSANGAVGTGVNITIYAHAEDVQLSGPTIGLTMQSKDEYGKGPVSGPASAIAYAMGALKDVPVIGRYATATSLVASSVGRAAAHLGYCNTPVIEDTKPLRPSFAPVLASTQQGFPVEKLTLDPKCEITVDNTNLGNKSGDELDIRSLVTRESYLTTISWDDTRAVDYRLFQCGVTPGLNDADAATNAKVYNTPLSWVAMLFQFWRGDIIFRFRVVASQYHRGRFRVTFDPAGTAGTNISNTATNQAACFNKIIDVSQDTNVEIRVPYHQALAWCKVSVPLSNSPNWTTSNSNVFYHVNGTTNGMLVARVVNPVTGPTAAANISILVSVRAAENMEFAAPIDLGNRLSTFVPQSDEYDVSDSTKISIATGPPVEEPSRYLTHMGECITTLRTLLHRYTYCTSDWYNATNVQSSTTLRILNRMPPMPGYDPGGFQSAKGLIATGTNFPYNWNTMHPITWISTAFIGYRGSMNWMANTTVQYGLLPAPFTSMWARANVADVVGYTGNAKALGTNSANTAWSLSTSLGQRSAAGSALTPGNNNPVLTCGSGFYSAYKYNTCNPRVNVTGTNEDDSSNNLLAHSVTLHNATSQPLVKSDYFASAGADWSPFFFVNVPVYYYYSGTPVAN